MSMNSNQSDEHSTSSYPSNRIMPSYSTVPEGTSVVRKIDGVMTFIGKDDNCSNQHFIRAKSAVNSTSNQCIPRTQSHKSMSRHRTPLKSHHSLKSKKSKKKNKSKKDKPILGYDKYKWQWKDNNGLWMDYGPERSSIINKLERGGTIRFKDKKIKRSGPTTGQQLNIKTNTRSDVRRIAKDQHKPDDNPATSIKSQACKPKPSPPKVVKPSPFNRGVICEMELQSEWDCLAVSHDQSRVALFSRNTMAILKINEYGIFEKSRDLQARSGRKDARLKYGAVDAEFYKNDANKLISCTRQGTLMVLDLNFRGRGCIGPPAQQCPLKQAVHKVTWIPHTRSVLAAAEDGKCYLWDTNEPGGIDKGIFTGGKSFNKISPARSVKVSPFNDNLFASSHKNGTVNIWDIRNATVPFLTITAHKSVVSCIDWHPAIPNVMASCGYRDITIKIWNLTDDDLAQQKYYDYWNRMSNHRNYNGQDDYRLSIDDYDGISQQTDRNNKFGIAQQPISKLAPNCSLYPSGHVSQIGWRPCKDPKSLSANQIACSYVNGEPVVDMWDIKSSYVPVASLSSHKNETKFTFLWRDRPFRDSVPEQHEREMQEREERDLEYRGANKFTGDARTYLITCSKDKSIKLTDCGFADIPRSHLSSCALDIAPFGSTCFVSVPRQKLHPFDQETYQHDFDRYKNLNAHSDEEDILEMGKKRKSTSIRKSSSMGELRDKSRGSHKNSIENHCERERDDNSFLNLPTTNAMVMERNNRNNKNDNKRRTQRSYSGTLQSMAKDFKQKIATGTAYCSDSECPKTPPQRIMNRSKSPSSNDRSAASSPARSIFGGIFRRGDRHKDLPKIESEPFPVEEAVVTTTNDYHVIEKDVDEGKSTDKSESVEDDEVLNAMADGYKQSQIEQLTDIFNHVDAFSQFETNLTCCPLNELPNDISPCDSAATFRYLAENYKLKGKSIPWICSANEQVAKDVGNMELQQLWNLLGVLLKNVLSSNNNKLPLINNGDRNRDNKEELKNNNDTDREYQTNTSISSPEFIHYNKERKYSLSQNKMTSNIMDDDDGNDDDNDEWWMDDDEQNPEETPNNNNIIKGVPSESYSPGQLSSNSNSYVSIHSMDDHSNNSSQQPRFMSTNTPPLKIMESAINIDQDNLINGREQDDGEAALVASYIKEVIEENIDRGDIQTAVTIIIMLNDYILQYLSEEEVSDIILSYLDLLLHDRLLIEAVKIYELTKHYKLIEQHFLSENRLISKCFRCKLTMRDHFCMRCRQPSRCAECNEELKPEYGFKKISFGGNKLVHSKLLIWCQICGHGGHFDHMTKWFKQRKTCLVDNCSHQCQPVLIAIK